MQMPSVMFSDLDSRGRLSADVGRHETTCAVCTITIRNANVNSAGVPRSRPSGFPSWPRNPPWHPVAGQYLIAGGLALILALVYFDFDSSGRCAPRFPNLLPLLASANSSRKTGNRRQQNRLQHWCDHMAKPVAMACHRSRQISNAACREEQEGI